MDTQLLTFDQLSLSQLYAILQLRQQVFIEEQQSIYSDIDGFDQVSKHLCIWVEQNLAAYARIREVCEQKTIKVERVVTARDFRMRRLGRSIMDTIISHLKQQSSYTKIYLSAQLEVIDFYKQWGFEVSGSAYDDGGILHKDMWLTLTNSAAETAIE
jgi:ElaA protein